MLARALIAALVFGTVATASAHAQTAATAATGTATDTSITSATATAAAQASVTLDHARKLVDFFWAGQADSLWAQMSTSLREKVGSPEAITEKLLEVAGRYGSETKVLEETIVPREGRFVYERTIELENAPAPLVFIWAYDADRRLSDVNMRPKSAM